MENEVLKIYEYAEQTIEISLVKEEEIPVMLELDEYNISGAPGQELV